MVLASSSLSAEVSVRYGACRDVSILFDQQIVGASDSTVGSETIKAGLGFCPATDEFLVGISQPRIPAFDPLNPSSSFPLEAAARCCRLEVVDGDRVLPVLISKSGPPECSNALNPGSYLPRPSYAHSASFAFVDTWPNYVAGDQNGVGAIYACNQPSYTQNHPFSSTPGTFNAGGSFNWKTSHFAGAVVYTGSGTNLATPACCSAQVVYPDGASRAFTATGFTWQGFSSSLRGLSASICPDGQVVVGTNLGVPIGGASTNGVFCAKPVPPQVSVPAPAGQCTVTTTTTCQKTVTESVAGSCSGVCQGQCPSDFVVSSSSCEQQSTAYGLLCMGGSVSCTRQTQTTYTSTTGCLSGDVPISSFTQQSGCEAGCFDGVLFGQGACVGNSCQYSGGSLCPVPASVLGQPYCQGGNVVRDKTVYAPSCNGPACSTTSTNVRETLESCPFGCDAATASCNPAPSASPSPSPTPNACNTQGGECRLEGACPSEWLVSDPDGVARSACSSG
ncbi:hypothetical protein HY572_04640, partial [Candidatus Micrarchaeota archaeon]|nr:hypothetical protein [Candidatus Micrarchaeota archaeon]